MANYNIQKAQADFQVQLQKALEEGPVSEGKEAFIYAKELVKQQIFNADRAVFCEEREAYVSNTPTGYAVTGYYTLPGEDKRNPFQLTVCKQNGFWYPSRQHVGADTKSCSGYIWLWILISVGCTLMGLLMYYLISAAIGF